MNLRSSSNLLWCFVLDFQRLVFQVVSQIQIYGTWVQVSIRTRARELPARGNDLDVTGICALRLKEIHMELSDLGWMKILINCSANIHFYAPLNLFHSLMLAWFYSRHALMCLNL